MKMVNIEEYIETRKKIDKKQGMFFGIVTGALLFVLFIGLNFLAGLIFGLIGFGFIYGLVAWLTTMQANGALKKLQQMEPDDYSLEVNYVSRGINERGLLTLGETTISYQPLLKMPSQKAFQVEINEDLFMAFGDVKRKMLHNFRFGDVQQSHFMYREMPHGVVRQFVFYNLDNLEDKVGERLQQISQFNAEKYQ
jgi:hypothetical protein